MVITKETSWCYVSDPISGSYSRNRTTFENIYNARKYEAVIK